MILYVKFWLSIGVLFLSISLSLFLYFSVSLFLCFSVSLLLCLSASLFISSSFSILLSFSLLLFSLYHSNSLSLSDFRLCWNTERSLICFIFVVIILLSLSLSLLLYASKLIGQSAVTARRQNFKDWMTTKFAKKQNKQKRNKTNTRLYQTKLRQKGDR